VGGRHSHYPNDTEFKIITIQNSRDIVNATDALKVGYLVDSKDFDLDGIAKSSSLDRYFSPAFLTSIRAVAACGVQASLHGSTVFSSNPKHLTVAAHIRRGDVDEHLKGRYVPDELFIGLLTTIKSLYPHADLHAFTSKSVHTVKQTIYDMESKYRAHNIHLHVTDESSTTNTEETLNSIAHFATADVFIMSKSSFSSVPAYYNPNCVIYVPFWHGPLAHYIKLPADVSDVQGAVQILHTDLPACVNSLAKSLGGKFDP
jgi:hypothetical protein